MQYIYCQQTGSVVKHGVISVAVHLLKMSLVIFVYIRIEVQCLCNVSQAENNDNESIEAVELFSG